MTNYKGIRTELDPDEFSEEEWLSGVQAEGSETLKWRILGALSGIAAIGFGLWIVLASPIS